MSVNVVVIGTGFGERTAAPAYRALGCQVTVVSPRQSAQLEQALAAGCDLVSIHSPPFMHVEHVKLAIKHGCHVLCDKPFGRNLSDAKTMLALAEAAGIRHFVNFEFRYDALRRQLKQLLDAGRIGKPQHFSSKMFIARGGDVPHGWLFEKEKGGGWIGAFASHEIDALHWLFGEMESCHGYPRIDCAQRQSRDGTTLQTATAEDAISACLRMKNGVTATIDTAFAAAINLPVEFTVYGDKGALQITNNQQLALLLPGQDAQVFQAEEQGLQPAMQHWLTEVLAAIHAERPLQPDFHTGVQCAAVLERLKSTTVL